MAKLQIIIDHYVRYTVEEKKNYGRGRSRGRERKRERERRREKVRSLELIESKMCWPLSNYVSLGNDGSSDSSDYSNIMITGERSSEANMSRQKKRTTHTHTH